MGKYLCEEDMSTGEYISRDEALKIFHQCCDNCTSSYNGVMCRACADADAMDILIDMPAADVQPIKRGRWIANNKDNRGYADCYTCTNCDDYVYTFTLMKDCEFEYCPNCGARMDGDAE